MNKKICAILQCSKTFVPNVTGICLNEKNKIFYVTSDNAYYNNKIIISEDGLNWSNITLSNLDDTITYHWNAICWSSELNSNCLCAIGNNGYYIKSTNGINWTLGILGDGTADYEMIYWLNSKYYAISTSHNKKAISADGDIWEITDLTEAELASIQKNHYTSAWNVNSAINDIAIDKINIDGTGNTTDTEQWLSGTSGPFAIINSKENNDYILINYDQNTKTFSIIYPKNNNIGLNVLLNEYTTNIDYNTVFSKSDIHLSCADYSDTLKYICGIANTSNICYTISGYDWTEFSAVSALSQPITDIKWANTLGAFYVITADGQNATSITGLSWSKGINIPTVVGNNLIPSWSKLCWSADLGLLVAISNNSYQYIAVSNDGRIWELREISAGNNFVLSDIKWIKELSQFIAVDYNSNKILTSYDANTWTITTVNEAFNGFKSITYEKANNTVYLLSNNRDILFKSNDLLIWEIIKLPVADTWAGIEWVDSKSYLALFGYEKILYTSDLINWKITEHSYDISYPLNTIEVSNIAKCLLINNLTGYVYLMNLKPGSDTGIILNDKQKWLISNYTATDNFNLVNNPNFINNTFDNWNIVGTETEDTNGIRKYLVFDNDLNINFAKVINRLTTNANNLGIESDWITVNSNTSYNCHLLAKAYHSNCYVYIYGQKADLSVNLIKKSDSPINISVFKDVDLSFASLDYIKVKFSILFTNPNYDDFFMFSNAEIIPYTNTIKDHSQFNNNAIANNYDIEFDSIISDNCIKLKGLETSYIEFAQPFKTNDRITIAAWFKFNDLDFSGQKAIIYSGTKNSNLKIYIKKADTKKVLAIELLQNELITDFQVSENVWYHIAYTYDLNMSNLYVNGKLINTTSIIVDDFDDMIYSDSSYFSRIGNLAKSNDSNYVVSLWDGNSATINWYLNNNSKNYVISSSSDLAGLAKLVNTGAENFSECTITLKTNIDLNNYTWIPIGFYNAKANIYRPFKGIFNGNNFEINNLNFNVTDDHVLSHTQGFDTNNALFGYVDGTGTGIIAAITSLTVNGNIVSSLNPSSHIEEALADDFNTSGIIAKGKNCKVSDCTFNGSITSISTVGSIMGDATSCEIYDCINNATVISTKSMSGGIVGYLNSGKIINCINNGNISLTTNEENIAVGGIAAYFYGGDLSDDKYYEISNCINTGDILGKSDDYSIIQLSTAGIIGQIDNLDAETRIQGCQNFGNITGISNNGGIVGNIISNEKNLQIYESFNNGDICGILDLTNVITDLTAKRNNGGIIGSVEYYCTDWLNIHGCINNGKISKCENAGGILGTNKNKVNIYNCTNIGIIENNYNSSGIAGKLNGFIKINNCLNIGTINAYTAQFPTYTGCIIGVTENRSYIYEDDNDNILSKYNIYLDTSLTNPVNIFDSNANAVSKTYLELTNNDILNKYLNNGINLNESYKYIMSYDDGSVTYNDIIDYLDLLYAYPLPEEAVQIIINIIKSIDSTVSEYSPLALSVCDVKFFDYVLSHKSIREFSHAKLLQYKCVHKSETNTNFIPVTNGTYTALTAKNDGDISPNIELITDSINTFGGKVWKINFLTGSVTSDLGYHSRVETEEFTLPSSATGSNFTYSIYIKGENTDINKLSFKFIVNNNEIPVSPAATAETIGSEALGGIYTRYVITTDTIAEPNATIYQIIGLKSGVLGTTDPNILEEDFTVYLAAPQLENKDKATDFISLPVIGKLYDSSTYMKHITFDLNGCPTYNENEHSYEFTPYKKIVIPNSYVKQSKTFTVSFWFKASSIDGYVPARFIIGRASNFFTNGAGWHISVDKIYNDIIFEAENSSEVKDARFYTGCNFTDWTYLTAVYDNGKMYTYVNGLNITSNESSYTMMPYIDDIIIGSNFVSTDPDNVDLSISHMRGDMIRDIKIFNTALDAENILELYQGSGIVDTTGILHAYNFTTIRDTNNQQFTISKKDLISTDWYNNTNIENSLVEYWPLSGISKNYTSNDNPLYINAIKSSKGIKNSKCIRFNGSNAFAYSKADLDINSLGSITISFWIKINRDYLNKSCIMEYSENANSNNAFSIYYTEDGYIQYNDYGITDDFSASLKSNTQLNDNLWHFITITVLRCKNIVIYIDCVKDALLNNYAESANVDSSYSAPKNAWKNEYEFDTPIKQNIIYNNNMYVNRLDDNNAINRYQINGDNSMSNILTSISSMNNIFISKYVIDEINNIIYFVIHNYEIGNSYIMSYNISSGIKKIITDCYYGSDLLLNSNRLFLTDRELVKNNNQTTTQSLVNITTNTINNSNWYSFKVDEIIEIYTGEIINDVFVKSKTFDSSLYELYNNKIIWLSKNEGDYPTSDYYVDFKYNYIDYTYYNVKCIDLNNIDNILIYNTKHTNIITNIVIDKNNNLYTSSYDGLIKKTNADGIVWTYDLFDSWIYSLKLSHDNNYIYASSRDNTFRKIDKNGNTVWQYSDINNCEILDFVITNDDDYIYISCNKNIEAVRSLLSANKIWTSEYSCISKLDNTGSLLWTIQMTAPVSNLQLLSNSNGIFATDNTGSIIRLNEIYSIPYNNHKIFIGSHNNSDYFFKGFMQDIKIYNRELTLTEMTNQYNSFGPMINKIAYITNNNSVFSYQDVDEIN